MKPEWILVNQQKGKCGEWETFRDERMRAQKVVLVSVAGRVATHPMAYFELDGDGRTFHSEAVLITAWQEQAKAFDSVRC
ncbi:MAG TPA: hypothetical protein VGD78_07940 [Chthoniobacterales bacterium]